LQNQIWTGATDSNYETPGNWNSAVPGSTDTAIFDSTATLNLVALLGAGGTTSVAGWTFNGGDYINIIANETFHFLQTGIQVNDGSATIYGLNGADIIFDGNSDGTSASFILDKGSSMEFGDTTGPGGDDQVSVGSLAGAGDVLIGPGRLLLVGGNNLSTSFTGSFTSSGTPGSLAKEGTGNLDLSGPVGLTELFVDTGSMSMSGLYVMNSILVDGGQLTLAGSGAVSSITITGGALTLQTHNAEAGASITFDMASATATPALLAINTADLPIGGHFATSLTMGETSNELMVVAFLWHSDATAHYDSNAHTLVLTDSANTLTFDNFSAPTGTQFAVFLERGTGGALVAPAIVATAPHELVDATHHPAGQHSPSNGFDVILGLGANDTIKGLGGSDILIGGAPGVELFGGSGSENSFKFEKTTASPPSHPDVIMDFSHAQGDTIDLYSLRPGGPGGAAFVFIGGDTFADYHHHHHTVFAMVRYSGGVVDVNFNAALTTELAITVHGAPALHADDFVL
jgi:Ca2+-binding RTX toxin-like protein